MTCIFALRAIADEHLLPQLAAALERRPELLERAQVPRVWRAVDVSDIPVRQTPNKWTRRRKIRFRALGIMMLILGVLLAVPELAGWEEVSTSLVVGALAIAWGIFTLIDRDTKLRREEKPETSAERLLHDLGGLGRDGAHAIFSEEELALETPDGDRETFDYGGIECALETKDLLILTDATRVVTLQKSELSWGGWTDFHDFLTEKVGTAGTVDKA